MLDLYVCLGVIVFFIIYVFILKKSLSYFDLWNIFDKCWGCYVCCLDVGFWLKDE